MSPIPERSDRSAWDNVSYPERHAKDLDDNAPVNHVPTGLAVGDVLTWDGLKWVAQAAGASVPPIMTLGTYEGELQVGETPFKIYNKYGMDREIIEVFLSVSDAPTGDDLVVDIKVAGMSIFSPGDEATILTGETTGSATLFADPFWTQDTYLTWEITQIGSSTPGSNLVIHIIHQQGSIGSGS